jgi:hypothetical protein
MLDETQPELFAGIIDNLLRNDEVTAYMVAKAGVTDRPVIKLNRLNSIPAAVTVQAGDTITSVVASVSASTFNYETIVRQFEIAQIGANLYDSFTDQLAEETRFAVKSLGETIAQRIFSGDGVTQANGIDSMVQNINAQAGATLSIADIDVLNDLVLNKSPDDFYVGTPTVVRAILRQFRKESIFITYDDIAGTKLKAPTYMGHPILKSQWATGGRLYRVNPNMGFQLVLGNYTDENKVGPFGLQAVGASEFRLAKIYRLYAHIFGISQSTQGIGCITGVV